MIYYAFALIVATLGCMAIVAGPLSVAVACYLATLGLLAAGWILES